MHRTVGDRLAVLRSNERLLVILVSTVLVMSGQGVIAPVLPLFASSLGGSAASVGLTLSTFALARLLLNVPLGALSDRRGRRLLLVTGPIVSAVGMLGSGLASDIPGLLGWRFVAGAGSALYMTGAQVYLVDISTVENRARVIGANQAALLVGVSIGPGLGGILADAFGFRVPFFAVGTAGLGTALYAWLRLPETHQPALPAPGGRPDPRSTPAGGWRAVLRSPGFAAVSFVSLSIFLTRAGGRLTLLPLLAASEFGFTAGTLGILLTAMAVINLVGIAPAASIADRFGRKWAVVPSGVVIAIALVAMATAGSELVFVGSALLLAIGTSLLGPAPAAYAADIAPPALRGLTMGLYRSAGDVGFMLGPVLLGALADATSLAWGLVANAGVVTVSTAIFGLAARETVRLVPERERPAA